MLPAKIELVTVKEHITVDDVAELFSHAEWAKKRTHSQIRRMLKNTAILVMARFQGRPAGFARVVTDQTFRAFVEDVIVVPAMRRRGVARAMMAKAEQLVKKLGVPRMELTSTQTGMWKKLGYQRKANCTYMVKYLKTESRKQKAKSRKQKAEKKTRNLESRK